MHRSRSAAILVASLLLALARYAPADSEDALGQARALLGRNDAQGAVVLLEAALAGEPTQRDAVLELLRQAYERAASEAEAAGDRESVEIYRDNLEILNRKPKSSEVKDQAPADQALIKAAGSPPESAVTPIPNAPEGISGSPDPIPDPKASLPPEVETPAAAPPVAAPPAVAPPQAVDPAPKGPEISVAAADAAFTAKRYADAGRIYMALARGKKLPESRRDHLAYCRCAEVVRRINAKPTTVAEWQSIDAEIRQIRELSPNNWYAEYLRNLASERSPSHRNRPSRKVVVRGSAPEELPFDGPRPPAGTPVVAQPTPAPAPAPVAAPPEAARTATPTGPGARNPSPSVVGKWQVRETPNFRIHHADDALAEQVAQVVESAREAQVKRWLGSSARGAWSSRCDVYLYPTAKTFSRMTGQNEDSPGFSTMGMNGGRIVTRRINVRADHPNLVAAILPHEVTHIVLADLFPNQQIPRWADEGMAVLSEPSSEQQLRAADLDKPLSSGQLFKLNDLMVMDYPDGKYWSLYYAQSVSLTRFLVEQGGPARFIQFVQGTQKNGLEAELKRIYQIDGFDDLQERWLAYARTQSAELTARLTKTPETTNR